MKFKTLCMLFMVGLVFSSCKKGDSLTDPELIEMIQDASRQMVNASELPADASSSLQSVAYVNWWNNKTEFAPELGYKVYMRKADGVSIGRLSIVYFNLEGKILRGLADDDGFISGNGAMCYNFIYPVTYIMPDGTEVEGESKEELELAVKDWYNGNYEEESRPTIQYPVDFISESDGSIQTANDETELEAKLIGDCE